MNDDQMRGGVLPGLTGPWLSTGKISPWKNMRASLTRLDHLFKSGGCYFIVGMTWLLFYYIMNCFCNFSCPCCCVFKQSSKRLQDDLVGSTTNQAYRVPVPGNFVLNACKMNDDQMRGGVLPGLTGPWLSTGKISPWKNMRASLTRLDHLFKSGGCYFIVGMTWLLFYYIMNCFCNFSCPCCCVFKQSSKRRGEDEPGCHVCESLFLLMLQKFSSGLEMANLVVSSGLLFHSWSAIREPYGDNLLHGPVSIKRRVHQQPPNCTVLAFAPSAPFTAQDLHGEGRDLVSSAALREHFPLFEFVGTKVNPSFSIHRAAVTRFASLQDSLSFLKDLVSKESPLIVTGHSIGGSIAVLFTLLLLESIPQKDIGSLLCITFGSPLIGDNGFQQAISERPTWNPRFLHVVYDHDPIPRLFVSPRNVEPTSNASSYKPFGTFLLCSGSGCACFEEPESVLDLMLARMSSGSVGTHGPANGGTQMNGIGEWDYGGILSKIMNGAICRGVSDLGEWDFGTLQTGIIIQMDAIEVFKKTQGRLQNGDIYALTSKIVRRAGDLLASKRNIFNPCMKLNDRKIDMAYIEWYKKATERSGGYYNAFRVEESTRREQIVKRKRSLTQYWNRMVMEAEKLPQKEGVFSRKAWLLGGTNYRRLVEPLDIAEWYGKGKEDYLANRSEHYKLLEQWVAEYGKLAASQQSNGNVRSRPASLTEDSCFWAHVEEAIISCKRLKQLEGGCREDEKSLRESLEKFENRAMELINKYAVSSEIFFKESSFMVWWENYKEIMGSSHRSSLADFMRNRRYKDYV